MTPSDLVPGDTISLVIWYRGYQITAGYQITVTADEPGTMPDILEAVTSSITDDVVAAVVLVMIDRVRVDLMRVDHGRS